MARVAGTVSPCAYHDVRLMGVFVQRDGLGAVFRYSRASGIVPVRPRRGSVCLEKRLERMVFGQGGGHPFQGFGDFPAGLCRFDASVDEEDHPVGTVQPPGETLDVLAAESAQASGFAQDVTSQGVPAKDKVFEIIENQFRRRIVVAFYFVDDHLHFFVHLRLGIGAAQYDVGQQVHGTCEVFFQESRIVNGFLFARIGVQVSSHAFHAVQDMPRAASVRPFESQVLAKMCQSVFVRQFVTRAGIDGDAAIYHVRGRRCTDDAHAAGKGMGIGNSRSRRCCCHVVMFCV